MINLDIQNQQTLTQFNTNYKYDISFHSSDDNIYVNTDSQKPSPAIHHTINHDDRSPIKTFYYLIKDITIPTMEYTYHPQANNPHTPQTLQPQRLFHPLQHQQGI